jgi:hypothetical protein
MSFLKFTGKKGSKRSEELDLPPLPPPVEGPIAEDNPIDNGPPLDGELPDIDGKELPEMNGKEPLFPESPDTPPLEFPETPPHEETDNFGSSMDEATPEPGEADSLESPEEKPTEETEVKPREGPIYLKIDRYKDVLREISKIKADFEKSEDILSSMVEIKTREDRELENWKHGLEGIRKKLTFIDATLFEGG